MEPYHTAMVDRIAEEISARIDQQDFHPMSSQQAFIAREIWAFLRSQNDVVRAHLVAELRQAASSNRNVSSDEGDRLLSEAFAYKILPADPDWPVATEREPTGRY